jgi:uncharacterized protein
LIENHRQIGVSNVQLFLKGKWPKVVKNWQWSQGLHWVGKNKLYVNRGLGTFPPGRWYCPPEVTAIALV